ncbi:MAG TPA: ABATE domain-containing protein [Kofleriaceae bacterium]|nr:ABATE domain-containing protein [Kofleriaceae bacterium]
MPPRSASGRRPAPAGELRDGFKFRGGRLALDFAASLAGRLREQPTDLLREPDDLGRWLVAAGLAVRPPAPTRADLVGARELREALYRLALSCARGRPLAEADRAIVNRWAARPGPAPQLAAGGALTWRGAGVPALIAAIARDGVELLGGSDAARIRACAGEGCAVLFLDTSRAGRRRWCSMASCGNQAKVRGFRRRARRGARRQ